MLVAYRDQLPDDLGATNVWASPRSARYRFLKMFPREMRKIPNSVETTKKIHSRKFIELISVRIQLLKCFK